jgi:FkbM family methyltransferase
MEDRLFTKNTFSAWMRSERSGGDEDVFNEVVINDTYKLHELAKHAKPKWIVDVGAHIGCFPILAKKLWPDATIVSVEPNPRSFGLLKKNIANLGSCHAVQGAVRYDGRNILTDGKNATGGGFMVDEAWKNNESAHGVYTVAAEHVVLYTLEKLMEMFAIPRIDLLKLDCEGSEINILESTEDATCGLIGDVVGEFHMKGVRAKQLFQDAFPRHTVIIERAHEMPIGRFWCLQPGSAKAIAIPVQQQW